MKRRFDSAMPCRTKKANFYRQLITFYDNIIQFKDVLYEFNATQSACAKYIEDFFNGKKIYPIIDDSLLITLKSDVVKEMRPIRKDKVAIYNALVLFMDAMLSPYQDAIITYKNEDALRSMFDIWDGEDYKVLEPTFRAHVLDIKAELAREDDKLDLFDIMSEDAYVSKLERFIASKGMWQEFLAYAEKR